jgi:hypothetical protein
MSRAANSRRKVRRPLPPARIAAGVFGAVYLLIGIGGFSVTGLSQNGTLLVLPVSPVLNMAHVLIGALGIVAFLTGPGLARGFCQLGGGVLAVLSLLGLILGNSLTVLPIGGMDVVLHSASALVLLYLGFDTGPEAAAG